MLPVPIASAETRKLVAASGELADGRKASPRHATRRLFVVGHSVCSQPATRFDESATLAQIPVIVSAVRCWPSAWIGLQILFLPLGGNTARGVVARASRALALSNAEQAASLSKSAGQTPEFAPTPDHVVLRG